MKIIAFFDFIYRKLPSSSLFWMICWSAWFGILWYLSSTVPEIDNGPEIPHFDKVLHFGYFMIGGFTIANGLYLKRAFPWKTLFFIVIALGAAVGAIDEYHQSFTPGRSGNDIGDWIADFLGTISGTIYCYFMWARLTKTVS